MGLIINPVTGKLDYHLGRFINGGDIALDFPAAKTLVLTTSVWKDINMGPSALNLISILLTGPDVVEILDNTGTGTGVESYGFAVGEAITGITMEMQHDYKEGTDFYFHIHWQGNAAPTGTDNVRWSLTYVVMRNEQTLGAAVTVETETAYDTQYKCKRSDFPVITGTNFSIGNQLICTLERVASVGDAYVGDAVIATFGLHYEIDTVGSRTFEDK